MSILKHVLFVSILTLSCINMTRCAAITLPQDEVDAFQQIMESLTMGATSWRFNASSCQFEMEVIAPNQPRNPQHNISCGDCQFENNSTICHIIRIDIKFANLQGTLPPELSNLPYLQRIDFAYNYLNGTIPVQRPLLQLKYISLLANRLLGEIPKGLGNFTSLTYLDLEANQFSGTVPAELGKLVNLETLMLSSNRLSGKLPMELAGLKNMMNFRINDNNFNGTIPDFIQNWKQLTRLEMLASGLEGPIPSAISSLGKLTNLRISDINGKIQDFPVLSNMTSLNQLVLRNCNISGEIPPYIWSMSGLEVLDLSFNKLIGELPSDISGRNFSFIFLTGNWLSGNVPRSILRKGDTVDLSYNNFTRQSAEQPACQDIDLSLNLFRSPSMESSFNIGVPCMKDLKCQQYWHSLYINCGGDDLEIHENGRKIRYQGDAKVDGGAARSYFNDTSYWGLSSTGDFLDDDDVLNKHYIATFSSSDTSPLYTSARRSPLSLTYYQYCLENENYTVSLHFAEIQFTNDKTYSSLGRRIFDIYIQDKLVEKDFNIEDEAAGVVKPITRPYNVSVTNNTLEIRFYWAGKGTTRIPVRGVYGPLISAISVDPNFIPRSDDGKKKTVPIVFGVLALFLIFLALGVLWQRGHLRTKCGKEKDLKGLDLQTGSFTLRHIKEATNNFDSANKIGEGGFGPVYKGRLSDGTIVAVKQLSSKSRQGNREFLNEIGMVSCLLHPNLVKIHGCCIEGNQLLLVYEYMENNSLARALFGPENCQLKLDWPVRQKICLGIARGLAFLHEESRLKIVHRDIKGTNVLLDRNLNPKISDFGLAKLDEEEKTHISTRIAGTIGYMAPEYALWGLLTYKADIYSFGVVALEIVSGKHNMSFGPENNFSCLLDWACHLQQSNKLLEMVDQKLGPEFNKKEAERMIKVALLCTNASPSLRPIMSEVANMLEGTTTIPDVIPEASNYSQDLRFKAIREHHKLMRGQNTTESHDPPSTSGRPWSASFSAYGLYNVNIESNSSSKTTSDNHKPMESSKSQGSEILMSTSMPSWIGSSPTSINAI